MQTTKTIIISSFFSLSIAFIGFGQIKIPKLPKVPKLPKEVKLGKKDKNKSEESETGEDKSVSVEETDKGVKSISLSKPQCVKDTEGQLAKFYEKFEYLSGRVEDKFSENNFTIKYDDLKRTHGRLLRFSENCKTDNPNFDHAEITKSVEKAAVDYEAFDKKYAERLEWAETIKVKSSQIKRYREYLENYPRSSFSEYYEDEVVPLPFTLEDKQLFLNPPITSGQLYGNHLSPGLTGINEMEAFINSSEFTENSYSYLDRGYENFTKWKDEEGLENISRKVAELIEIQKGLFPTNENLAEVVNYAQRLETKMGGAKTQALDAIAVSEFHRQNMNKIFFTSNVNLDPKTATASDFSAVFKAGDQIKGIAYLDQTVTEMYGSSTYIPEYYVVSSSDENHFIVENYKKGDGSKPYVEFYISRNSSNYKPTPGNHCATAISMQFLADLAPRNHTLKVHIYKGKEPEGTLKFDATSDAGMGQIKTEIGKIRNKHLADKPLPKAKMVNSAYQKQLVTMFNSIGWEETFKKAIISSSEWNYVKSYTGKIVGRTLAVYMVSTKNGQCMYQDFTVIQDKTGSGYGGFKIHGTGGQSDISCGKVN